jgi:hypothetical protein
MWRTKFRTHTKQREEIYFNLNIFSQQTGRKIFRTDVMYDACGKRKRRWNRKFYGLFVILLYGVIFSLMGLYSSPQRWTRSRIIHVKCRYVVRCVCGGGCWMEGTAFPKKQPVWLSERSTPVSFDLRCSLRSSSLETFQLTSDWIQLLSRAFLE